MLDKIKSMALEGFLKKRFGKYFENGDVKVSLNSEARSCSFSATLAGEPSRITVTISKFEIIGATDTPDEYAAPSPEKFLCVRELECDRKWLECALKDYLVGAKIKLPSFIAGAL